MASIERLMQVLDKANTGPVTNLNDWGLEVGKNIQEKLAKYKIANTCDLKNPINIHDDLADAGRRYGFVLPGYRTCHPVVGKRFCLCDKKR
jgi:hypothetical protein